MVLRDALGGRSSVRLKLAPATLEVVVSRVSGVGALFGMNVTGVCSNVHAGRHTSSKTLHLIVYHPPVHAYIPSTSSNMPHCYQLPFRHGSTPYHTMTCHGLKPQGTDSSSLRARPRRLSVAMSAAEDGVGGGGMGEDADDDTSSAVATKPKKKVNSELDDLVGEMAGRASDEPVIIPRGAGITPMSPGPIKADPIPGMDGEEL